MFKNRNFIYFAGPGLERGSSERPQAGMDSEAALARRLGKTPQQVTEYQNKYQLAALSHVLKDRFSSNPESYDPKKLYKKLQGKLMNEIKPECDETSKKCREMAATLREKTRDLGKLSDDQREALGKELRDLYENFQHETMKLQDLLHARRTTEAVMWKLEEDQGMPHPAGYEKGSNELKPQFDEMDDYINTIAVVDWRLYGGSNPYK